MTSFRVAKTVAGLFVVLAETENISAVAAGPFDKKGEALAWLAGYEAALNGEVSIVLGQRSFRLPPLDGGPREIRLLPEETTA